MYVKGGRARCYLACSLDEISASSFRPSFPLLPRSSSPSLPSSYAFFLFCFYLLALSPAYRISPRRSCKVKTFSARAIVRLLIALGFPLLSPAFFSSYLNLSFFPWLFFFFSPHLVFLYISSKLGGFSFTLSFTLQFFSSRFFRLSFSLLFYFYKHLSLILIASLFFFRNVIYHTLFFIFPFKFIP